MSINTPKDITYTSSGAKTLKFRIQFTDGTVYYSHAQFVVTHVSSGTPQARYSGNDDKEFVFPRASDGICPELSFPNPEAWLGSYYGARVTVEYGNIGNRPTLGCTPQFIKPLIVIEGYDASKFEAFGISNWNYNDFAVKELFGANGNLNAIMPSGNYLSDELEDAGYDFVFVDLNEGTGDIIRNAYLLENIIRWVNDHKINNPVTGSREQNVVLGQSMGGLIARYATADLEKKWVSNPVANPHHEVRLLITQDTPHRGANVPLGLQAMVNKMANYKLTKIGLATYGVIGAIVGSQIEMSDIVPALRQADQLLDEPASEQMLIVQDGKTNTFLNGSYRSMVTFNSGYTPSFSMRAISNGSECGTSQNLQPGGEIFYADANLYANRLLFVLPAGIISGVLAPQPGLAVITTVPFLALVPFAGKNWKTKFIVNAAPSSGTNQVFYGKISIEKKVLFLIPINITVFNESKNSLAGELPWDSAPGGYYSLNAYQGKIPNNPNINAYPIVDVNLTVRLALGFNFVSTVSALDISTTPIPVAALTSPYTGGSNLSFPSLFPTFVTQEKLDGEPIGSLYNTRHIQFTARNANWIFNEMEGIIQPPSSCTYLCSNLEAISGPSMMCSSNTIFSLNNPPANATITWQATPSYLFSTSSGTGSSANLTLGSGSSNGTATITFTITGAECGPKVLSKIIEVGKASINYISFANGVNEYDQFCSNAYGNSFTIASSSSNPSSTEARILNFPSLTVAYTYPYSYPGSNGTYDWNYIPIPNNGWYVFEARVTNGCGTTDWFGTEVEYVDCGDGEYGEENFVVFPNPSISEIYFDEKLKESNSSELNIEAKDSKNIPIKLELINDNGGQVFQQVIDKKSLPFKIDTRQYKNGIYYLRIYYEEKLETLRIEINN